MKKKKRLTALIMACILLLCMTACGGGTRFEDEAAMFEYLNGMWLVEDYEKTNYYIFQDGQVYFTNDSSFEYELDQLMNNILNKQDINALIQMDYQEVVNAISIADFLNDPLDNVIVEPKKGMIILNQGKSYEKHIIIDENAVTVKDVDEEFGTTLTKLSDKPNLSGEKFQAIFDEVRNDFSIPSMQLLPAPDEYLTFLKSIFPEAKNWILVSESDTSTVYTSDGNTKGSYGSWIQSEYSLDFFRGRTSDGKASLSIMYDQEGVLGQDYNLFVYDRNGRSLSQILSYTEFFLEQFPGAQSSDQLEALFEQEHTVSYGMRQFKKTIAGITYVINQSTSGNGVSIYITFPEKIMLSDIPKTIEPLKDTTTEDTTLPTVSTVTEPVETEPVNDVPYTTSLKATDAVYKKPDSNSTYVQSVGQSGVYTIVEESYDSAGNLWGKLKSGIGWVLLSEVGTPTVRTCPKCGKSSPEVSFSSGTSTCDGCNYNNQGGSSSVQTTPGCNHSYTQATCTTPKTCTLCGNTDGSATGHKYTAATCTTPKTCTVCAETTGSVAGHTWKDATCTEPERCTVCKETGADAHGHWMLFTKCRHSSCDYTDYSCIAGTYANIGGYGVPVGTTTMVDVDVTNVSVSNSGEFCFTFNGKKYTFTLKQNDRSDSFMAYFDCYLNGELLDNAVFRAGSEVYNNRIYLDGFIVDGCKIYLDATR